MDTQNDANISKKVFLASDFMASFWENKYSFKNFRAPWWLMEVMVSTVVDKLGFNHDEPL